MVQKFRFDLYLGLAGPFSMVILGFSHIVACAGMQCSFPVPEVLICGDQMEGENNDIPFIEKSFLQQSIRRAGFAKVITSLKIP